ncbi:MAG: NTP transferase domain-containing protein [Lachnospiraceae bacterium]|nr:NTP transferase domain-containing protein [Lachnospiraceae bacterium]
MMDYIIVQAGGKGTRLKYLTKNKPKALVPVENLPMLFHLFRKYPDKKFVIIADYKKEVMHAYLEAFADVKYQIVDAEGEGTCAGVKQAINLIPKKEPFMLVWSDLILPKDLILPAGYEDTKECVNPVDDYIGISKTFPCRWSYIDGTFVEESSSEHGVAGFFLFTEKEKLKEVPQSGELVRWMQNNFMTYKEIELAGTKEFGLIEEYNKLEQEKCRPFNKMTIEADQIIKEGIDEQGKALAVKECAWYEKAKKLGISNIPRIYAANPLVMERIDGENIYAYQLDYKDKKDVLRKLIDSLNVLHKSDHISSDIFNIKEVYYKKTFERMQNIRDLVPFAKDEYVVVNGRKCRNVFFHKRALEKKIEQFSCKEFCFIHGDCTFSNIILRKDGSPVLIDPRGYFGHIQFYGDPLYDWAKLYYSIVGNYDKFNLKEFNLEIGTREIKLEISSNHWEDMEPDFFEMTQTEPEAIKLLHAIIWLSLTTYAWQDYDSICGAFYNGLYYLEEML